MFSQGTALFEHCNSFEPKQSNCTHWYIHMKHKTIFIHNQCYKFILKHKTPQRQSWWFWNLPLFRNIHTKRNVASQNSFLCPDVRISHFKIVLCNVRSWFKKYQSDTLLIILTMNSLLWTDCVTEVWCLNRYSWMGTILTHLPLDPHICFSGSDQHCFM